MKIIKQIKDEETRKRIKDEETRKRLIKEKLAKKESSMLSYENSILPKVLERDVIDEEGNVVMQGSTPSTNSTSASSIYLFSTPPVVGSSIIVDDDARTTGSSSNFVNYAPPPTTTVAKGSGSNMKLAVNMSESIVNRINRALADETAALIALEKEKMELARETLKHDKERNESLSAVLSIFGNLLQNPALLTVLIPACNQGTTTRNVDREQSEKK